MMRRAITAGIWGGAVLMLWTLVVNGMLGFQARIDMKTIAAERQVYEVLKEHIDGPGRYIINPELTSAGRFPGGEPVFSVLYGGVGHEAAGRLMLAGLMSFFLAPILGAWMLSHASAAVLASYPRKVMFFTALGILLAIFTDLTNFGIARYPLHDALLLATNHLMAWTLVGLVVAWRIKPQPATARIA